MPYRDLPDHERETDRDWARRALAAMTAQEAPRRNNRDRLIAQARQASDVMQ